MIFLDKNENIIFEIRKHWIVFFGQVVTLLVLALLPILLVISFNYIESSIKILSLYVFISSAWWLFLWIIGFIFWTNYYLDVWIVTNHKILSIDQRSLFSRQVSIVHLDKIQDVTFEVTGFLRSLMNFGDIEVKTAGHVHIEGFKIRGVPNPAFIQAKINEALIMHRTETHEDAIQDFADVVEKSKDPIDGLVNPGPSSPEQI